jgi:hypothetical protein
LILFACAAALPAAALAAEAASPPPAPVDTNAATGKPTTQQTKQLKALRTWSLKPKAEQEASFVGPAVPAPKRQRLPAKRTTTRQASTAPSGGIKPVNATSVMKQALQRDRRNNNN